MPDLETLSLRPVSAPGVAERFVAAANSAQRVICVQAYCGAPLEQLARRLHAADEHSKTPLLVLEGAGIGQIDGPGSASLKEGRATLVLLRPDRAPHEVQQRVATRLRQWRQAETRGPRVLALFDSDVALLALRGALDAELAEALDGLTLLVPPLDQRPAEIAEFAHVYMALRANGGASLAPDAVAALVKRPWPGGERELELWLERAALLAGEGRIEARHVTAPGPISSSNPGPESEQLALGDRSLAAVEAALIERVLQEQDGNVSRCAAVLGIHRSTLHAKLRALPRR